MPMPIPLPRATHVTPGLWVGAKGPAASEKLTCSWGPFFFWLCYLRIPRLKSRPFWWTWHTNLAQSQSCQVATNMLLWVFVAFPRRTAIFLGCGAQNGPGHRITFCLTRMCSSARWSPPYCFFVVVVPKMGQEALTPTRCSSARFGNQRLM